ncbi:MAG: AMP-binding protein [Candidatus Marinimicrobia bacterium]|nr:AMP-binding protein [Candidatus Neomarinimicrobiota bacterium]
MKSSLQTLISNVIGKSQNIESELTQYFNALDSIHPKDKATWSEEILVYASEILKSENSMAQILLLEQGWNPSFTVLLKESNIQNAWFDLEMRLIRRLNYTPGKLFFRREAQLKTKNLFTFKDGREWESRSWSAVRNIVDPLAAGLIDLVGSTNPRFAILSENRIEVAYTDICCLSYGFVNVPMQPAAPPLQLAYILQHAEIEGLFISDLQHLKAIEGLLPDLPFLKHIITFEDLVSSNPMVHSFKHIIKEGSNSESLNWLEGIRLSVSLDDIASIMYTSGTTGHPKGIVFTHENIISKRFARSLVFNLGEMDRFLCFLPLFHTFGRFLEMWGSIFWGAEYTFSSGKGIQSLLADIQDTQPSVLISIPKRWQDIYENIASKVDVEHGEAEVIHPVVEKVIGENLHWGLSAAGYLPPEVFRFFQVHGLNLHSGYGMTEATGGITMTPTGNYIENSVGIPLPGMEVQLAEDGELWIKGVYVSKSYWKPEITDDRPEGWFTTGDIFQPLDNGQIEIIDRKKEIYKNAKGQTIAPQKIENMFRDFDSIKQLFIVGDHRPYNTALVRLNRKHADLKHLSNDQDTRDYVASVIHSVNSFLAPFERIVDFLLVDRDFDKAHDELTEKGTFKRSSILKNFDFLVQELYEKAYKSYYMGKLEIQIPNWIFRQRGWTQNDLEVDGSFLRHRNQRFSLKIKPGKNEIRIGSFNYWFLGSVFLFDDFIRQPAYCIGNRELEAFADYSHLRIKPLMQPPVWLPGSWTGLEYSEVEITQYEAQVLAALENSDNSLEALNPVINLIYAKCLHPSQPAFRLLARIYSAASENIRHIIRYAFLRLIGSDDIEQSRFAAEQVLALYPANELEKIVQYALEPKLLFPLDYENSRWSNLNKYKVSLAINYLRWLSNQETSVKTPSILIQNVLGILYSWSSQFPQYFASIRSGLISATIGLPESSKLNLLILEVFERISSNFSEAMVVSESSGENPYEVTTLTWDDVLVFDKSVSSDHRHRIFSAFSKTKFLSESMFLFFNGKRISLQHIAPQGIWVTPLRSGSGKYVYRATVQSNEQSYKFVINLADDLSPEQLKAEIFWLMACAKDDHLEQLVEAVGSYQDKYKLWSEEFIPGLTVKHYLEQATWTGTSDENPSPEFLWPHFLWTGILTYTAFWRRTRFTRMICIPLPQKIIVPIHDYHGGGRLVSITGICPVKNDLSFLENLELHFATNTQQAFPQFNLKVDTNIIYHAIHEALGHHHSARFFAAIVNDPNIEPGRLADIKMFLKDVEAHGFQTKTVYFATRRYHRWLSLNQGATLNAKAHFLKDLYRDYHIQASEEDYPDARVQLFFWTVFSAASESLKDYLSTLARNLRKHELDRSSLQSEISQYISVQTLDEYEAFFLKRLAFPQLPPSEDIELIATRSTTLDEVEIMISRYDNKGGTYRIRRAMHPKEIIQLQRLFLQANMEVGFTHEHKFLVAINNKDKVIGGLFYNYQNEDSVYMEKVVVAENHRRSTVSRGLLDEFINRMKNEHRKSIVTGFLHPGYFYKFGFKIEKDQGGLIKYL